MDSTSQSGSWRSAVLETPARPDPPGHPAHRHVMRSVATRVIHLLLLLSVVHQLVSSQFIERPFPGEPNSWTFDLHQYVGLASLAVLAAFWGWVMIRRGETRLGRLLPWFSKARCRDVMSDGLTQLRRLGRGRAPDDADGALSSAVHGLGLLVVTAMAVSGTVYFLADGTAWAHDAMAIHKLLAKATYAYLFGHAGLALLHHFLGSDIFSRMFWTRRGGRPDRGDRPAGLRVVARSSD